MVTHSVRDPEQYRGTTTVLIVATPGYTLTAKDMDWIEHVWLGRFDAAREAKPKSERAPEEPPAKRLKPEPREQVVKAEVKPKETPTLA